MHFGRYNYYEVFCFGKCSIKNKKSIDGDQVWAHQQRLVMSSRKKESSLWGLNALWGLEAYGHEVGFTEGREMMVLEKINAPPQHITTNPEYSLWMCAHFFPQIYLANVKHAYNCTLFLHVFSPFLSLLLLYFYF